MMRSKWIAVFMGCVVLFLVSSCATVPTGPLAPGELKLLGIHVPEGGAIKGNLLFMVNISFEADGKPEIRTACFSLAGDGPHCFRVLDVNYGSPGAIKVQLRTDRFRMDKPGSYLLEGYALYLRDGKTHRTNGVSTYIYYMH